MRKKPFWIHVERNRMELPSPATQTWLPKESDCQEMQITNLVVGVRLVPMFLTSAVHYCTLKSQPQLQTNLVLPKNRTLLCTRRFYHDPCTMLHIKPSNLGRKCSTSVWLPVVHKSCLGSAAWGQDRRTCIEMHFIRLELLPLPLIYNFFLHIYSFLKLVPLRIAPKWLRHGPSVQSKT